MRQFGVPLAAVWDMTRDQVRAFYLCEVDREGNPIDDEAPAAAPSATEQWRDVFRRRGLPEHRVEAEMRRLGGGAPRRGRGG